jgi:parvulin-like peptidyl-prolyl isomerase
MSSRALFRPLLAGAALAYLSAAGLAQQTPIPAAPTSVSSSASAQIIPANLTSSHVAATVNGEKILVGEVRKILDEKPYPNTLTEDQKRQIRQAALDVLVEDAVMRQFLARQVPKVTQEEFNKEYYAFADALKNLKTTIAEELKKTGQTEDQLRNDLVAKLRWKTLLRSYYPDEKLKPYYDANKPFFDKVYVQASHILIKLPPKHTKEQADLARQRLLVWRQDILKGGRPKFEEIAKQYSECPSKEKGGDIGKFPYKFVVVPEFARTAFAMQEGQVSDVVQTVFGMHLIMVTNRDKGEPSNFETSKDVIREVMAQDDDLYPRLLSDQRKTCKIDVDAAFK